MTKETSKKERAKEFAKKNKKKLISAGVLLLAGIVYCFCNQEINIDSITETLCTITGGC